MDIDESRIGQWPNVAVEAGTPPQEAMERYGIGRDVRDGRNARERVEDMLVLFAQEWLGASSRIQEMRCVRRWAREIAEEVGGDA